MSYDEFKQLCRRSWKDDYSYLSIDKSKKKIEEDTVFVLKAKPLK